jgi:uroporphyrinogen III methyltransferase/synthase
MMPRARPLAGLRIAVTRPAADAEELAGLLREAGAVPVLVPLTRVIPPASDAQLRHSLARLSEYHWVAFTSINAVRAVTAMASWEGVQARIAAVGTATAAAVHALTGREADVIPAEFTASALAGALLASGSLRGTRVLWPRAERSRGELRHALEDAGAVVDDPIAYRTVADRSGAAALAAMARLGQIDTITFTAPSAVDSFADASPGSVRCAIAVIGPATAAAARARGLRVHVEPEQHIIPALVRALARFHTRSSS